MPPKFRLQNEGLNYKVARVPVKRQESPRFLTAGRKEKLNNFLKKVDIAKEKEKLFYILTQKCYTKYPGAKRKVVIDAFVQELIENKMSVSPTDIANLDKELHAAFNPTSKAFQSSKQGGGSSFRAAAASGGDMSLSVEGQGGSNYPETTSSTNKKSGDTLPPIGGISASNPNNAGLPSNLPIKEDQAWLAINAYNQVIKDEKAKAEEDLVKAKNKEYLQSLQKQIDHRSEVKKSHKHDDDNYVKYIYDDIEKYHREEKEKFEKIDQKHKHQMEQQKAQIEEKSRRLKAEKDDLFLHEMESLAEIARLKKEDEEKIKRIREQKVLDLEKAKAFNAHQKVLHEEHRQALADEEKRLQAEYIRSENAKEEKRAAEFKARQDRLDYFFAKSNAEGGAGHKQREDEIREEQLLLKNQQAKEERDAKAERDKAEMIARKTKEALMQNEMLKAKKAADREKQKEDDKKFGAQYRKESEDYIIAEKEKAMRIKRDNLKYQEELRAQMKIEKHDTDKGISVTEKDLNKGVFKTIEKDPVIAKKVAQQLRIAVTNPRD